MGPVTPDSAEFKRWIATRPRCIQEMAKEFPPGYRTMIKGKTHHLIGYSEPDVLLLSPIDPSKDYEMSVMMQVRACASHFRN